MSFHSILTGLPGEHVNIECPTAPQFLPDLNLDQVIDAITASRADHDLKSFFYAPLTDPATISYRHEVFLDLENLSIAACLTSFTACMRSMRSHRALGQKLHNRYQQERWFLDAAAVYCDAVSGLAQGLARAQPRSRGLQDLRHFLADYIASTAFASFRDDTGKMLEGLSSVRYGIQIKGNRVRVSKHESEPDYAAQVEATFAKFKEGAAKDYRVGFPSFPEMNPVEARVLDLVVRLFPETFAALDVYSRTYRDYIDGTISSFDREIQFYLAYIEYASALKGEGLHFCLPRISTETKEVSCSDAFDIALATKLLGDQATVVTNDFQLSGKERIIIVTGPNQGGKTTFARMFGQLHYLASLGCPVPAKDARLFLFDHLFTHFEGQEHLDNLTGKLETDFREILDRATPQSIIVMNEIFSSTTLGDALFLGRSILERVVALDLLCVYVTFIDELASFGETTVSVASTVRPENPALRTYKVVRRPADGRAYAIAIAEKHGLTYERLKARIPA